MGAAEDVETYQMDRSMRLGIGHYLAGHSGSPYLG